jgi:hypothetical protein
LVRLQAALLDWLQEGLGGSLWALVTLLAGLQLTAVELELAQLGLLASPTAPDYFPMPHVCAGQVPDRLLPERGPRQQGMLLPSPASPWPCACA